MALFSGAKRQVRNFSSTTPNLAFHARRQNGRFAIHNLYNASITGNTRYLYRPDPLNGRTNVLWNAYHEDHPWDEFGNQRPTSTFSEKGMAFYKLLPFNRRLRQFVNITKMTQRERFRCEKYAPSWYMGMRHYYMPPHMIVPPGYRPMTEWPAYDHADYSPWMDLPNVRRTSPVENHPEIFTKHADDRAKKMDVLKFKLAASNFRVKQRAKYESKGGDVWMGAQHEHKQGGTMTSAGPSPLWNLRYAVKRDGEQWSMGAGLGTFPKPSNKMD